MVSRPTDWVLVVWCGNWESLVPVVVIIKQFAREQVKTDSLPDGIIARSNQLNRFEGKKVTEIMKL